MGEGLTIGNGVVIPVDSTWENVDEMPDYPPDGIWKSGPNEFGAWTIYDD